MASTNAALSVVVVLAFSMVGAKSPCEDVDPTIRRFTHDFINNTCLYIRHQQWKDYEESKRDCDSLERDTCSGIRLKWHLVALKTEGVINALNEIMVAKVGKQDYDFWIGLVRDQPDPSELNQIAWANPAKWRWISDNTTLLSWSNYSQVPWAPRDPVHGPQDPNGWTSPNPDRCVLTYVRPGVQPHNWWDAPCIGFYAMPGYNQYLICESMDVSTSTTTSTTTATTAPKEPETNSSCPCLCSTNAWKWVAIALAIIMIAAVVTYLGYRAFQYHRNRQQCILSEDWIALHST